MWLLERNILIDPQTKRTAEMAKDERGFEERCIFRENGKCFFNEAYPTTCNLCFNYVSVYPTDIFGSKKIVTMFDYLKAKEKISEVFPSTSGVQSLL